MRHKCIWLACLIFSCHATSSSAQLLNKLKQKAEQKAIDALDKSTNKNQTPTSTGSGPGISGGNSGNSSGGGSGNPSNNSGEGLISTPPDVKQNLADAEVAYKKLSYGEARYSVQQAMLGVELEIGNKVLKSLPETISGLKKNEQEDQVASNGYGWAGLIIKREYSDNKNKQLTVTIANNAMWMSAVNMYFSNGGYAQQTGGEQKWKQIKVKGYRAIIEYDEGSGYKLSVPLGQSSMIVYEGINFASEQEMTTAAAVVDIDGIKKMLGEQ
jgi:hypothetical protein